MSASILPIHTVHLPTPCGISSQSHPQYPLMEKIVRVCRRCFESLIEVICFPLRYIGSKSWSIPGVILRTPFILFKRLFIRSDRTLVQELFPTDYRFSFEKTLTREELKPYYPYACATAFVHQNKEDFIPSGWTALSPETLAISLPGVETLSQCLFDSRSGFKASLIEKDQEIIVAFGSLEAERPASTHKKQPPQTARQVLASVAGLTSKALLQADALVKVLHTHPYFQGKSICLTGNSYGGTIAAYAGLKNDTRAVCLNAFPLGAGPQYSIGQKRLRTADQYITHISMHGDYVTDLKMSKPVDLFLSGTGFKTPGNFGHKFRIPAAYQKRLEIHCYTLGSVMAHLGHDKRTKPVELAQGA